MTLTFEEQFRELQPAAHRFARSILHQASDAEDSVHNAVVKALAAFEGYDPSRPFKAWFFKILKNCCLDRLRQRKREEHRLYQATPVSDQADTTSVVIAEEVQRSLAKLSAIHQEILRLRYYDDMSYRDMADYLDIPNGTVMSRLHAARLAFAQQHGDTRD